MLSREEIEKEINLGNFEYVIEKCNEYLNLKSDLAFLYNYRGLCKNNLGLYEEAIKDFDISIELNKKVENIPYATNKDLADAYYYKGLAKNNLKKYNEAIEYFEKSLKFEPAYWLVVYYNIGVSKINLGEYEESIKNFDIITYQNIYKEYYNRIIRKEIYDSELYNYYTSIYCSIFFTKLILGEYTRESFNMFLELSKCFNPNNNHIFNIVSLLFGNYKYDLIEKIFNYLVEENYNDLWENDITFNLLKNKTRDKEILKNIKKNLLYQYLLLQSLSFNNKTLKREFTYNIEIAHYTSLNTLLKLIKEDNKIRITNISNANDPKEGKILENILNKNGALNSCMTGTGSAVYGIFEDEKKAISCKKFLNKTYKEIFLAFPFE